MPDDRPDITAAMTTDAHDAFGTLLQRHRGIVFKVVNTYTRHPDDRDELAQEIAVQLWRAYPGYDPTRTFSTWMYRIALNVAISFVRTESNRQRHAVPLQQDIHDISDCTSADCSADDTSADHEADERVRALYRFIGQQDPLNRALLLLYLEDHSHREIADILGISETNVATKISRLKQRIRSDITD